MSAVLAGTSGTATALAGGSASVAGSYGTLTINAKGTYSYTPNNAEALAQVSPADVFTYTAKDVTGATTTTTLTFNITGQNDAPVVTADVVAVNEGTTAATSTRETGVLGNDADPDTDETATLVVSAVLAGTSGTATALAGGSASVAGSYGTLTINAKGTYSYTPNNAEALAQGASAADVFTYTAKDVHGATTTTLTFNITGQNDAPVVTADVVAVNEGTTAATSTRETGVLGNDADPDTDETATLVVSAVLAGTSGTATALAGGSAIGQLWDAHDQRERHLQLYAEQCRGLGPGASAADVFTYTAKDVHGATTTTTLTFNITGQNDAPVVTADVVAVNEGTTAATSTRETGVLGNDADPDTDETATLVVSAVLAGTSGTATALAGGSASVAGSYGTLTINAKGTYSYTPNNAEAFAQVRALPTSSPTRRKTCTARRRRPR